MLQVINYSEKAVALVGDTKAIKDTWVSESDNDLWTDDDGEQDPCESFTDDEDWKLEQLERLYNQFAI